MGSPIILSSYHDARDGPHRRVGVLVVAREPTYLEECLRSLREELPRLTGTSANVLVIAPAPPKAAPAGISADTLEACWVPLESPAAIPQALNESLAVLLASCRLLVLMWGDIVTKPGALKHMLEFLRCHPEVDGCVGGLYDPPGHRIRLRTRISSFWPPPMDRPHVATYPGTALCMLRAEAFFQIGGFVEDDGGDWELEWAQRAQEAQLRFQYLPDATGVILGRWDAPSAPHRKSVSTPQFTGRFPRYHPDLKELLLSSSVTSAHKIPRASAAEAMTTAANDCPVIGESESHCRGAGAGLDDRAVAFVTCVSEPTQYLWCRRYIEALEIPDGFRVEVHVVPGAKGLPSAYNAVMRRSNAKYKVYLHQDVFLLQRRMLYDVLDIFSDPGIGLIGVVGATRLPVNGVWFRNNGLYCHGQVLEYRRSMTRRFLGKWNRRRLRRWPFRPVRSRILPVAAVDGLIMVTQYDVPWREDLYDGFIYYEGPQCLEFIRRGLAVVIPRQEPDRIWCLHYGPPEGKERTPEQDAAYQAEFSRVSEIFRREYGEFLRIPAVELLRRYRQESDAYVGPAVERGIVRQRGKR